jgi:hypothetical protein
MGREPVFGPPTVRSTSGRHLRVPEQSDFLNKPEMLNQETAGTGGEDEQIAAVPMRRRCSEYAGGDESASWPQAALIPLQRPAARCEVPSGTGGRIEDRVGVPCSQRHHGLTPTPKHRGPSPGSTGCPIQSDRSGMACALLPPHRTASPRSGPRAEEGTELLIGDDGCSPLGKTLKHPRFLSIFRERAACTSDAARCRTARANIKNSDRLLSDRPVWPCLAGCWFRRQVGTTDFRACRMSQARNTPPGAQPVRIGPDSRCRRGPWNGIMDTFRACSLLETGNGARAHVRFHCSHKTWAPSQHSCATPTWPSASGLLQPRRSS